MKTSDILETHGCFIGIMEVVDEMADVRVLSVESVCIGTEICITRRSSYSHTRKDYDVG